MRAALRLLIFCGIAAALVGCHKPQQPAPEQNIAIENSVDQNADIEALPSDESSGTSSNELMNGSDNPDVNATDDNSD